MAPVIELERKDMNFAVLRGLEFLAKLGEMGPEPQSLHAIRAATNISKSSAHRILNAAMRTGFVEQPIYGLYQRTTNHMQPPEPQVPVASALPAISHTTSLELSTLQLRTQQIVLLHAPALIDNPQRLCAAVEYGVRLDFMAALDEDPTAAQAIREAPLHSDAAGLVLLAYADDGLPMSAQLRGIRAQGYTVTPSPLNGYDMCSVPVMRGTRAVAVVSLVARAVQMDRHQTRYIEVTQDAAAALSGHCSRHRFRSTGSPAVRSAG